MEEKDINNIKLKGLITASKNAGGELEQIMKDSLKFSYTEKDFEITWYYNLNHYANRVIDFHNVLAERNGYDCIVKG